MPNGNEQTLLKNATFFSLNEVLEIRQACSLGENLITENNIGLWQ